MSDQFDGQQKELLQLLKVLDSNNILPHVILAGSWAEYVYAQSGLLPGYVVRLRTLDIDFLVKNLRKPTDPISIPSVMREKGYTIMHDTLMGTTKIVSPGGLDVEFLIPQKGSGVHPILKTNLGVNAQALRHMEAIIANAVTADLFGMKVQVPCPESYVLHKMLINDVRTAVKKIKDRDSIVRLLPYIDLNKVSSLFEAMTKKEKNRIRTFIEQQKETICHELKLDARVKFMEFVSATFPELKTTNKEHSKNIDPNRGTR